MNRALNLLIALILLPATFIFISATSILIIFIDHMTPFYTQKRPGKDGIEFTCFKLRTLRHNPEASAIADPIKDSIRLTRLGIFLRNRGLDELPQILNILIGNMTFIGPRPLHPNTYTQIESQDGVDIKKVRAWKEARLAVLPGLSGWQQIHANGMSYDTIGYDLDYLSKPSISKKILIILISIWIMLIGKQKYFNR
jgi:undecaprenyl phosphate N,N'-diacetylbacillosamine 1-phosphate transferase